MNEEIEAEQAKALQSQVTQDFSSWLMIRGILILLIGIFAISWPQLTIGILVKGFGAFFILDGLWGAIVSFQSEKKNGGALASLLGIVLGIILLFATVASVRFFLILVGSWAFIQGIAIILFRLDRSSPESRTLFGISGAVLALAGLILLVWPVTGVVAVSWLLGATGIVAVSAEAIA